MEKINRIKVVLVERDKPINEGRAARKDYSTVSKWCTNTTQPNLKHSSKLLEFWVEVQELLVKQPVDK